MRMMDMVHLFTSTTVSWVEANFFLMAWADIRECSFAALMPNFEFFVARKCIYSRKLWGLNASRLGE